MHIYFKYSHCPLANIIEWSHCYGVIKQWLYFASVALLRFYPGLWLLVPRAYGNNDSLVLKTAFPKFIFVNAGKSKFMVSIVICMEVSFSMLSAEPLFLLLYLDWDRVNTSVGICLILDALVPADWIDKSTTVGFSLGRIIFQYLSHNLFKHQFSLKWKWD